MSAFRAKCVEAPAARPGAGKLFSSHDRRSLRWLGADGAPDPHAKPLRASGEMPSSPEFSFEILESLRSRTPGGSRPGGSRRGGSRCGGSRCGGASLRLDPSVLGGAGGDLARPAPRRFAGAGRRFGVARDIPARIPCTRLGSTGDRATSSGRDGEALSPKLENHRSSRPLDASLPPTDRRRP